MTAWYNENDEHASAWLENLILERLIAPGIVDRRSIRDVRASELTGFTQCHFFAGIGGWSYALRVAGWPDARPVWTGSCPCQPFSLAGARRGFDDDRHLWPVWRELIRERRPATIFGEQVASAAPWLGLVRGDLEALGYAVGAIPLEAASAGADHLRDRFWFVADRDGAGLSERERNAGVQRAPLVSSTGQAIECDGLADAADERLPWPAAWGGDAGIAGTELDGASDLGIADRGGWSPGQQAAAATRHGSAAGATSCEWTICADGKARRVKPGIRLLAHGVPNRVGLLRGFGNAIDPRPASEFIRAFIDYAE